MIGGVRELAESGNPEEAAGSREMLDQLRQLTAIIEHEMHETVLTCTRARRQMLKMYRSPGPTRH